MLLVPGLPAAQPEYADEGAKSCLDCHGSAHVMGILDTKHAQVDNPDTPAAQKACESCHGPSKTHTRFPMQVGNVHFGKGARTSPKAQNRMCLECHGSREEQADWHASAHGFEDVVCSTCHSIHDPERIVPAKATVSSGCSAAGCHDTLMEGGLVAEYSHAVGQSIGDQGEVTCTGCHNPHGQLSSGRCLDCHPQSPELLSRQTPKAQRYHRVAEERGTECMRCHKGLAHPIRPLQVEEQREAIQQGG